jgi:hypothetical protein
MLRRAKKTRASVRKVDDMKGFRKKGFKEGKLTP